MLFGNVGGAKREGNMKETLKEQIKKKLAKGKAIAKIADEIEETEDKVLELIGQIKSE